MSRSTYKLKQDNLKARIADVIIDLNDCERIMKGIISKYILSNKIDFIEQLVLNNSIINFGSKMKLVAFIIKEKEINVDKKFFEHLYKMIKYRNALAHSDTLLIDFEMFYIGDIYAPYTIIPKEAETIIVESNGELNKKKIEEIIESFNQSYKIVKDDLTSIYTELEVEAIAFPKGRKKK